MVAVQSVALYRAELWWQGQRNRRDGIQLMINQEAHKITGMLKTTIIGPLVQETGLASAETLLEAWQLGYTTQLLGLLEDHSIRKILSVSFWKRDQHAQPGEQTPGNQMWAAENEGCEPWSLEQHLAQQLAKILSADSSGGFEKQIQAWNDQFPDQIKVPVSEKALEAAQTIDPNQTI